MIAEQTDEVAGLPPPSPELVLIRVFVQAYLATAHEKPRRRARAFLDAATRTLADEESVSLLLPYRPSTERAAVNLARRRAVALFRALTPSLVAKLPPE
jgi:hypothetical protein